MYKEMPPQSDPAAESTPEKASAFELSEQEKIIIHKFIQHMGFWLKAEEIILTALAYIIGIGVVLFLIFFIL